ncbi:MAG: HNH endonuclease [Clostridiales bacterium]|nr:HNH endonuclease [Clostridiales bacterium]
MLMEVYYEHYLENCNGAYWKERKVLPYMVLVRDKTKRDELRTVLEKDGFRCVAWNEDYPGILVNVELKCFGMIEKACKHSCINDRNYSYDEFVEEILGSRLKDSPADAAVKRDVIQQDQKLNALLEASKSLLVGDTTLARDIINEKYPFVPVEHMTRKYTTLQMMEQFFRDGFIDRYSGKRLLNPGILRVLSAKLPEAFPFHAHWKTSECHLAYWDYQPTVDHIFPIALGGQDEPENWATTSMLNNSAKSNFTLEQLGWSLKESGDISEWDGLSEMFVSIVEKDDALLEVAKIREWYQATRTVFEAYKKQ